MENIKTRFKTPLSSLHINIIAIIAIIAVNFIIYGHTLNSSFHFDDDGTITNNNLILNPKNVFLKYNERPIYNLSFAINYYFGKFNTFGYHMVNLLLHCLNGILVYFVVLFTLKLPVLNSSFKNREQKIAFFTALIFVAHPIRAESVIYLSSRSVALFSFFYLCCLLCFIFSQYKAHLKNLFYFLAFISSLLALASKEAAVTLPFAIILFDFMLVSNLNFAEIKKRWKFYALLFSTLLLSIYIVVYGHITGVYGKTSAAGFGTPFVTPFNYLLTEFSVVLYYIILFLFPVNLNLDYDWHYAKSLFEFPTFFSFLVLIGIVILVIKIFKSKPLYAFWIIWYFLVLSPDSSIVPLKDVIFLHRAYLPSLGPILLFVIGIDKAVQYLGNKLQFKSKGQPKNPSI